MQPNALASGVLAALIAASAAASQVGNLTTFTPGTPARASEVNANFDALKNAVNDTDARVTAVENGKQNRVTGSCPAGMAVAAIAADGSVTCEQVRPSEGSVPVHAVSFQNFSSMKDCNYRAAALAPGFFIGAENSHCTAAAQVQLPQGAEVTGVSCLVHDGGAGGKQIRVNFARYPIPREATGSLIPDSFTSIGVGSTGNAPENALQVLRVTPAPNTTIPIVDNENYAYLIVADFYSNEVDSFTAISSQLGLRGCTVDYRY
jgi:hypothetical protein